ncbi:KpsF/GutQ family sugar-phosphate isomerase [Asticcacaulis excentricus]|uniref:KpsF/GutQ family protein n=1 Tax=Asticcacaulis excentricus (strain ATCC 15261 / DSM 4724 / KCTC 12464 / NCIMB 9791 / VKM B-1370 / CB 48) TaxID=573065 RepID=E8RMQ7_ASTEC|nr:KpsF/GutQ family sugar-phosphate isomerase [Asticcacaulis excentricus]ADU13938.1 KpsF/GutQ family protein [Asticcacaulis excentricus CB 48]
MVLETALNAASALQAAQQTVEIETAGLQAMRDALDGELGKRFEGAISTILDAQSKGGRIIVTGMGKSGHIGRKIAASLASTGALSHFVHPAEASHGDLGMVGGDDVVLALSWSGEAPELADIIAYTRRFSVPLIAITSGPKSALGSAADIALVLPKMAEACPNGLAPTTSTTMQLAMGDCITVALLSLRKFTAQDFRQFHPGGKLGSRLLKVGDLMHSGDAMPLVSDRSLLSEAIVEISSKRYGMTGIVDAGGRLIGIVTDGDLRRAFSEGFNDRPVSEIMTRAPRVTTPDTLASQLLAEMNARSITGLFAVEKEKPVGVIHLHEILRAGVA